MLLVQPNHRTKKRRNARFGLKWEIIRARPPGSIFINEDDKSRREREDCENHLLIFGSFKVQTYT